jgi:hypothetical protein
MMLQAYRVSIEAAGVDARPAWADLVKQDQSISLSKTPQWADCICSCDHFSDATLLFRGEDGRRLILPRLRNPSLPGIFASPPRHWNLGADASGFLGEGGPPSPRESSALIQEIRRHPGLRTRVVVGKELDLLHRADRTGTRSVRQLFFNLVEAVHRQGAIQLPESGTTGRCRGVGQYWAVDSGLRRAIPKFRRQMGSGERLSVNVDALACPAPAPAEKVRNSGPHVGGVLHCMDSVAARRAYRWDNQFDERSASHLLAGRDGQRTFAWHRRERTSPSLRDRGCLRR